MLLYLWRQFIYEEPPFRIPNYPIVKWVKYFKRGGWKLCQKKAWTWSFKALTSFRSFFVITSNRPPNRTLNIMLPMRQTTHEVVLIFTGTNGRLNGDEKIFYTANIFKIDRRRNARRKRVNAWLIFLLIRSIYLSWVDVDWSRQVYFLRRSTWSFACVVDTNG